MTELLAHLEMVRPWFICESKDRWHVAACRFAPQLMPAPLIPSIVRIRESKTAAAISADGPAVVLWEVRRESVAAACDRLARTTTAAPQVLQLVAGSELSDRERIVLSELNCAAVIRHPEDLPRLATMIRRYFATAGERA